MRLDYLEAVIINTQKPYTIISENEIDVDMKKDMKDPVERLEAIHRANMLLKKFKVREVGYSINDKTGLFEFIMFEV